MFANGYQAGNPVSIMEKRTSVQIEQALVGAVALGSSLL